MHAHGFQRTPNPRDGDAEPFRDDIHRDILTVAAEELGGILAGVVGHGDAPLMSHPRPLGILGLGEMHPADLLGDGIHSAQPVTIGREYPLPEDGKRSMTSSY
jgi:hypothetical protein